jgi:hypothetical protein
MLTALKRTSFRVPKMQFICVVLVLWWFYEYVYQLFRRTEISVYLHNVQTDVSAGRRVWASVRFSLPPPPQTHTCKHVFMHAVIHMHKHSCAHTHAHAHSHARVQAHAHAHATCTCNMHIHMHIRIHIHMHMHMHTRLHVHAHTLIAHTHVGPPDPPPPASRTHARVSRPQPCYVKPSFFAERTSFLFDTCRALHLLEGNHTNTGSTLADVRDGLQFCRTQCAGGSSAR